MRTVLVTGPIGSGKSEACRYLASLDFPVYECDARTKMLYSLVPGLKCRIEERLGLEWSQISTVFLGATFDSTEMTPAPTMDRMGTIWSSLPE